MTPQRYISIHYSDTEIQLVESKIGSLLVDRGYELSNLPSINLNNFQRQQLKIEDWWYRVQFRIKRLGLSLFIANFLSKKLGLKSWQKQIKLEMNEIEKKYLK